jgi:hypothetical protein
MATLDNIIARLQADTAAIEKTASAEPPREVATPADPSEQMLATVRALSAKTASAEPVSNAAVPALDKIAADVAAAEEASMKKLASVGGQSFCDAFMARLAQYDTLVGTKTASAPAGFSQADLEAAYLQGQADLEKQAAAEYEQGQNAALEELHKVASELHIAGQQSARNVLLALSK